jgi:hypothetical protein
MRDIAASGRANRYMKGKDQIYRPRLHFKITSTMTRSWSLAERIHSTWRVRYSTCPGKHHGAAAGSYGYQQTSLIRMTDKNTAAWKSRTFIAGLLSGLGLLSDWPEQDVIGVHMIWG